MQITKRDLELIKEKQPGLVYDKTKLSGHLVFKAKFSGEEIKDRYKVEIHLNSLTPLPLVKEVGGRIEDISRKKLKDLKDLHINAGDVEKGVCLCSRIKSVKYFKQFSYSFTPVFDFIEQLVVPFFYGMSYFEKFNSFPFSELDHGDTGILQDIEKEPQLLLDNLAEYAKMYPEECDGVIRKYVELEGFADRKKVGRNEQCPCGSNKKYKRCHLRIMDVIHNVSSNLKLHQQN